MDKDWFDWVGRIHHVKFPSIKTSENSILFTSTYKILSGDSDMSISAQHNKDSHDNKTGYICLLQYNNLKSTLAVHKLIFGRTWIHPRDLALYAWNKYPFLMPLCAPIVSLGCIISCRRTWRTDKFGNQELTTSGKMLSLIKMISFDMKITLKICTWLINRNKMFRLWTNVASIYFSATGHPIPRLVNEWENKLK